MPWRFRRPCPGLRGGAMGPTSSWVSGRVLGEHVRREMLWSSAGNLLHYVQSLDWLSCLLHSPNCFPVAFCLLQKVTHWNDVRLNRGDKNHTAWLGLREGPQGRLWTCHDGDYQILSIIYLCSWPLAVKAFECPKKVF